VRHKPPRSSTRAPRPGTTTARRGGRLTIRHELRAADDGYRSELAPGLRSSSDAERLADELAGCGADDLRLAGDPPGLYAEVASEPDIEEASWLALLIVLPRNARRRRRSFRTIRELRTSWRSGELPARWAPARAAKLVRRGARRADARRLPAMGGARRGSQAAAFTDDPRWTETQRFERVFERLALPAFDRRARFDLL
jgi:hypothetical protein